MIFDIDYFLFIWYLHDLFIHGFCFSLLLKVPEQKYYVAIITKKKAICHMQFILLILWTIMIITFMCLEHSNNVPNLFLQWLYRFCIEHTQHIIILE